MQFQDIITTNLKEVNLLAIILLNDRRITTDQAKKMNYNFKQGGTAYRVRPYEQGGYSVVAIPLGMVEKPKTAIEYFIEYKGGFSFNVPNIEAV